MQLEQIPGTELVRLYNAVADKPVSRFSDRKVGLRRLEAILQERRWEVVADEVGIAARPIAEDEAACEAEQAEVRGLCDEAESVRVDLYKDPDGVPYETGVRMPDAFPEASERAETMSALKTQGQAWTGGGASPATFVALSPTPSLAEPLDNDAEGMREYCRRIRTEGHQPGKRVMADCVEAKAQAATIAGVRPGTKQAKVLELVTAQGGASEADVCDALGWTQCATTIRRTVAKAGLTLTLIRVPGQKSRYFASPVA